MVQDNKLPGDVLELIIACNFLFISDIDDLGTVKNLLFTCKRLSSTARRKLLKNPHISHTLAWAQFLISIEYKGGYDVLNLDLGLKNYKFPQIKLQIEPNNRRATIIRPELIFPLRSLLESNVIDYQEPEIPVHTLESYLDLFMLFRQLYLQYPIRRPMLNTNIDDLYMRLSPLRINFENSIEVNLYRQDWKRLISVFEHMESDIASLTVAIMKGEPLDVVYSSILRMESINFWWSPNRFEDFQPSFPSFVDCVCVLVNRYYRKSEIMLPKKPLISQVQSPTLFASSLIRLSKHTPNLYSLSLSCKNIETDYYVIETKEFTSTISYPLQPYFTTIDCNALVALESILDNCKKLIALDLSCCCWVTVTHVRLIAIKGLKIECVNFINCKLLPDHLAKLFCFSSSSELRHALLNLL